MTRLLPVHSPVKHLPKEEKPSSPKSPIEEKTSRAASPTFDSASQAQFSSLDFSRNNQTQSETDPEAPAVEELSSLFPELSEVAPPFKNESATQASLLVEPEPTEENASASSSPPEPVARAAVSKHRKEKEGKELRLLINEDWIAAVMQASNEADTKMKGILAANNFETKGLLKIFKEHVFSYRNGSLRFPE